MVNCIEGVEEVVGVKEGVTVPGEGGEMEVEEERV